MRNLLAFAVTCALVVPACGGSDTKESIALADLPAKLAPAFCALYQRCNPELYGIAFAVDDCATRLTQQLTQGTFSGVSAAVDAKRTSYDGALAAACASAVSSGSCDFLDNSPITVCEQALEGTVSDGGDCDIDEECKGTSHCAVTGGACPGKCTAAVSAGVACQRKEDCAAGLVCSDATQHCAAPAAAGQPCGGGVEVQCSATLQCLGDDATKKQAGVCKQAKDVFAGGEGDSCDIAAGPWCKDGFSCVVDGIANAKPVEKCHAKAASGGSCGLAVPNQCPASEFCPLATADLVKMTFTANCQPLLAEGATCVPARPGAQCQASLFCDASTNKCSRFRNLGESCTANDACYSTRCDAQVCVPVNACAK